MDGVQAVNLLKPPPIVYTIRQEVLQIPLTGDKRVGGGPQINPNGDNVFTSMAVMQNGTIFLLHEMSGAVFMLPPKAQILTTLDLDAQLPETFGGTSVAAIALAARPNGGVIVLALAAKPGYARPHHMILEFDELGKSHGCLVVPVLDAQTLSLTKSNIDIKGRIWLHEYGRTLVLSADGHQIAELPSGMSLPEGILISNKSPPSLYDANGNLQGTIEGFPKDFEGPWQLGCPGSLLLCYDHSEPRPDPVERGLVVLAVYRIDADRLKARFEERIAWPVETYQEPIPGGLPDALPILSKFDEGTLAVDAMGNVYLLQYTPSHVRIHRFHLVDDGESNWRKKFEYPFDLTDAERQLYYAEYLARLGLIKDLNGNWKPFFAHMVWYPPREPLTMSNEDRRRLSGLKGHNP